MTTKAFDEISKNYDAAFTHTPVGKELRQIVWDYLAGVFQPGDRLLEMSCGTGEDALWLASRGLRVLATDGSQEMLSFAKDKAIKQRSSGSVEFQLLDLSDPTGIWPDSKFDGAFSNFGGLNCVQDLGALARVLRRSIKTGGHLIVVVMGRVCAWEVIWHLLHFRPRLAFRRLSRDGARARVGSAEVRVWYPSVRKMRRMFGPQFQLRSEIGIGVAFPPTYMWEFVGARPRLYRAMERMERMLGAVPVLRSSGDHILLDFERVSASVGTEA